jgi:hypothetical protein
MPTESQIADHLERISRHLASLVELVGEEPRKLPTRYARVIGRGENVVGEVEAIERGGYRVTWLDADVGPNDIPDIQRTYLHRERMQCAQVRVKDVRAVHSVDWLSEGQYARIAENIERTAKNNVAYLYRCRHWPDGYKLVTRPERYHKNHGNRRHGFRRLADGKVYGFDVTCAEAQAHAWDDQTGEGEMGEWEDVSADLGQPPAVLRLWKGDALIEQHPIPAVGESITVTNPDGSGETDEVRVYVSNMKGEGLLLTDHGSKFAIIFREQVVAEQWVSSGDHFKAGDFLLVFGEADKPAAQ